jgi:hypothetical protein
MTEVNEPRAAYEADVEDALYADALERYVGEWIAIFDGTLVHSPDPDEISAALPPNAFPTGKAFVTFVGRRPPYFVRA